MDIDREIKWTLSATEEFEIGARIYLTEHGYVKNDVPLSAWSALASFSELAPIYRMSLEASLGIEGEELEAALEAYAGSRLELSRQVIEALALAEDPSRASSVRASWTSYDQLQEMRRTAQEKVALETAIKELQTRLRLLTGEPDSLPLNSDSDPTSTETSA
jgi:hypothetical protein